MHIREAICCKSCGKKLGFYCGGELCIEIKCHRCKRINWYRIVYK